MTYEKFEHKAIGMLLEGNDPRLEKLAMQAWDAEILSREETEMGFNVKILAPAPLSINESEGRISGLEVKLSESEIFHVELVIKDGLLDRLKGTSTTEMSYAEVVKRYNDLAWGYKNSQTSEMTFQSDNQESDGVTFVKNIATISKEIDASILKGSEVEKEAVDTTPDGELIEEPFTLATGDNTVETESIADMNEVSAPSISDEEVEKMESDAEDTTPEDQAEIEDAESLENTEDETVETDAPAPDEVKKELAISDNEEDSIMMPPSFSIPKVPDVIQKRWTEEGGGLDQAVQPAVEIPEPPVSKKTITPSEIAAETLGQEDRFNDILDGKAPQGPISLSEPLEQDKKQEHETLTPEDIFELEVEVSENEPVQEEMESEALSVDCQNEVDRSIELMEKKTKALRITTVLIVVITIALIWFVINLY